MELNWPRVGIFNSKVPQKRPKIAVTTQKAANREPYNFLRQEKRAHRNIYSNKVAAGVSEHPGGEGCSSVKTMWMP